MSELFKPVPNAQIGKSQAKKVSIVGAGSVGMAAAFSIMVKELANVIAIVDISCEKVRGEVLDMKHGKLFVQHCDVIGSTDYRVTSNSDVIFITAGARQKEGESRLDLVQRNVDIFKQMIPELVKNSPNAILVVVSNPVDILTYVTAKLSCFPPNRVIGTGTMLDSARFRTMLGEKLGCAANSIHAYIIGEHGDSSVPVWSKVSVAGAQLCTVYPRIGMAEDPDKFDQIHKNVIESAYEVIKLKGYTSWAIGLACAALANALLNNQNIVIPVTTNAKGFYCIQNDVYLSLPCLINANGVTHVVTPSLTCDEQTQLQKSVKCLSEIIDDIKW